MPAGVYKDHPSPALLSFVLCVLSAAQICYKAATMGIVMVRVAQFHALLFLRMVMLGYPLTRGCCEEINDLPSSWWPW